MKRFLSGLVAVFFVATFTLTAFAADCNYAASKEGGKFHAVDCPYAKNIKADNKVCYKTTGEAKKAGCFPCCACMCKIVGSKEGGKFHIASCPIAKNIKKENLIEYKSIEAAEKAGLTACERCNPAKCECGKVEKKVEKAPVAEKSAVKTEKKTSK